MARDTYDSRWRSEDGDGSMISVAAGAALFLLASAFVAGAVVLSLGATAISQANVETTAWLRGQVQEFQRTAWSDLKPEAAAASSQAIDGRQIRVVREVTFDAAASTYELRIAAPRAQRPGAPAADCTHALRAKISGCLSVAGAVVASPTDLEPRLAKGVTLTSPPQQVLWGAGGFDVAAIDPDLAAGTPLRVTLSSPYPGFEIQLTLHCGDLSDPLVLTPMLPVKGHPTWYRADTVIPVLDRVAPCPEISVRVSKRFYSSPFFFARAINSVTVQSIGFLPSGGKS